MLTQNLPSGYNYPFSFINVTPMYFGQVLEYVNNCPDDPLEKFFMDYSLVKNDDPRVDDLLLTDLDYLLFVKQAISVSEDEVYHIDAKCPRCGRNVRADIHLSNIRFKHLTPGILGGLNATIKGKTYKVRIPTVKKFLELFDKYKRYKKITDLRLIKIISLFDVEGGELNKVEDMVIHATTKTIKTLVKLEELMLNSVEPIHVICSSCAIKHDPENYELEDLAEKKSCKVDELTAEDINNIKLSYGGMDVTIKGLTSAIFQDIVQYNQTDPIEISTGEVL